MKKLVDFMSAEDKQRYEEIVELATTNKANAPKPERKKKELTADEKVARAKALKEKYEAKLAELLAAANG